MILPLKTYPEKILRIKAEPISFPLSPAQKKLIKDMVDTVKGHNGIGLAAPQVGKSQRIIVINLEHLGVPIFALINPKITKFSNNKSDMEEGCLSIPGVFGMVERPESISFEARDLSGKKISIDADKLLARVVQHEIDHLDGILIIDKIKKYTQGKELLA